MRPDGRRPDQLRSLEIIPHYQKHAEGSALVKLGDTWVLCAASVEEGVPGWMKGKGKGWLTAEYAMLPRVLLEIILGNATWLQVPEVRRALLANPRLGTDQALKVLRLAPRHELRLAAIQTAYPHAVRNAAKLLLRGA